MMLKEGIEVERVKLFDDFFCIILKLYTFAHHALVVILYFFTIRLVQ